MSQASPEQRSIRSIQLGCSAYPARPAPASLFPRPHKPLHSHYGFRPIWSRSRHRSSPRRANRGQSRRRRHLAQSIRAPADHIILTAGPVGCTRRTTAQRVAHTTARNAAQVRDTSHGIARGSRRFGQAVWAPVVRLSGVLWLELTGVFFGLFALFATIAAWKLRSNFAWTPTNADAHTHLELALGMALLFSYFAITSFVRANRKGRRR